MHIRRQIHHPNSIPIPPFSQQGVMGHARLLRLVVVEEQVMQRPMNMAEANLVMGTHLALPYQKAIARIKPSCFPDTLATSKCSSTPLLTSPPHTTPQVWITFLHS
ncbi:hypothetical protein E2C01_014804 [Portunus trituberculatus]|uniref:Uncharacterized protein n=1 Tax=Portunus trituberculatus TaxID=210409 RepID=A0A5B7DKX4_PORTR|nr:hypothetical protein [Portunus trituberculatus]